MPDGLFALLLLFETWVDGEVTGYTEEIHLLQAAQLIEAQSQADLLGKAQECDYDNAAGELILYRFCMW